MSKVKHMWQETVTDNGILKDRLIARQEGDVVKACIENGRGQVSG
jgi:hypothetical protein